MSSHDHTANAAHSTSAPATEEPIDAIVPMIPIVLPVVGGVLMFLLAFIAVFMA